MNFPDTRYNMSRDATPFVSRNGFPRQAYNPLANLPAPIFPWEAKRPMPSRQFPDDEPQQQEPPQSPISQAPSEVIPEPSSPCATECTETTDATDATAAWADPATPTTPTNSRFTTSDPWNAFPRNNAWDNVPEISRYVDGVQRHQRTRSGGRGGLTIRTFTDSPKPRPGLRVTDFPTAVERPSLPVTPAPVQRENYFGQDDEDDKRDAGETLQGLPSAAGVPAQADWVCVHGRQWHPKDCICDLLTDLEALKKDPEAQLQKLADHHHQVLMQRLQDGSGQVVHDEALDLPKRDLPFGSEDFKASSTPSFEQPEQTVDHTPDAGMKVDTSEGFASGRVQIASSDDGY